MRVVLDTNVLVTGLLTPQGWCGDILNLVGEGELTVCFDFRILWEYHEVLNRKKFRFAKEDILELLDRIEKVGLPVTPSSLSHHLPDRDDDLFLEVAIAGHVDCLVTGNLKDFPPNLTPGIRVLSPRDFMRDYLDWKRPQR